MATRHVLVLSCFYILIGSCQKTRCFALLRTRFQQDTVFTTDYIVRNMLLLIKLALLLGSTLGVKDPSIPPWGHESSSLDGTSSPSDSTGLPPSVSGTIHHLQQHLESSIKRETESTAAATESNAKKVRVEPKGIKRETESTAAATESNAKRVNVKEEPPIGAKVGSLVAKLFLREGNTRTGSFVETKRVHVGQVQTIDPANGDLSILYDDGDREHMSQHEFESHYVTAPRAAELRTQGGGSSKRTPNWCELKSKANLCEATAVGTCVTHRTSRKVYGMHGVVTGHSGSTRDRKYTACFADGTVMRHPAKDFELTGARVLLDCCLGNTATNVMKGHSSALLGVMARGVPSLLARRESTWVTTPFGSSGSSSSSSSNTVAKYTRDELQNEIQAGNIEWFNPQPNVPSTDGVRMSSELYSSPPGSVGKQLWDSTADQAPGSFDYCDDDSDSEVGILKGAPPGATDEMQSLQYPYCTRCIKEKLASWPPIYGGRLASGHTARDVPGEGFRFLKTTCPLAANS